MDIEKFFFANADAKYANFQHRLIPSIAPETIIGVRTPILRKLAKDLIKSGDYTDFLNSLPHKYFDENQLHVFILSEIKDFHECLSQVEKFLPYIDNWATCDQLSPKVFTKHRDDLKPLIYDWLASSRPYIIRFGIGMAMAHFLDNDFDPDFYARIATIKSSKYYVNMMIAWYFATALTKQWDSAIKIIESRKLDTWAHNKTIQKARESYRISKEQKDYLQTLKVKS